MIQPSHRQIRPSAILSHLGESVSALSTENLPPLPLNMGTSRGVYYVFLKGSTVVCGRMPGPGVCVRCNSYMTT